MALKRFATFCLGSNDKGRTKNDVNQVRGFFAPNKNGRECECALDGTTMEQFSQGLRCEHQLKSNYKKYENKTKL